jgi:hypothetical protein
LDTHGAIDLESFQIDSRYFLAVANAQDTTMTSVGQFTLNSTIYEYNSEQNKFVKFQEILTHSCLDIEYFAFGQEHFLIFVNHYDENKSGGEEKYSVTAKIYKWKSIEGFVLAHQIPCHACTDFEFVEINGQGFLIASMGRTNEIKIFKLFTY